MRALDCMLAEECTAAADPVHPSYLITYMTSLTQSEQPFQHTLQRLQWDLFDHARADFGVTIMQSQWDPCFLLHRPEFSSMLESGVRH